MSLKRFIVTIEEMISQDFEVFAETDEEANQITSNKYNSGEFVLEPGNLVAKHMKIYNVTDDQDTYWYEF